MKPKFLFGDVVVVEENLIGIILKTWRCIEDSKIHYDVYVREFCSIVDYAEDKMERYAVRHKYLNEEEIEYQKGYEQGF